MFGVTAQIGIVSALEQLVCQLHRGHLLKFFLLRRRQGNHHSALHALDRVR
jgi:hypothetical protein